MEQPGKKRALVLFFYTLVVGGAAWELFGRFRFRGSPSCIVQDLPVMYGVLFLAVFAAGYSVVNNLETWKEHRYEQWPFILDLIEAVCIYLAYDDLGILAELPVASVDRCHVPLGTPNYAQMFVLLAVIIAIDEAWSLRVGDARSRGAAWLRYFAVGLFATAAFLHLDKISWGHDLVLRSFGAIVALYLWSFSSLGLRVNRWANNALLRLANRTAIVWVPLAIFLYHVIAFHAFYR